MKIKLDNVKSIDLCYENFDGETIEHKNILGFYIQRKLTPSKHLWRNKFPERIKTFEIALKDTSIRLRSDLTQVTINYNNGDFEHFHIVWDKSDWYDSSSLIEVHKKDNYTSLTSNCKSVFLK